MISWYAVNTIPVKQKEFFTLKKTAFVGIALLVFLSLQALTPGFLLASDSVLLQRVASGRTHTETILFSFVTQLGGVSVISFFTLLSLIFFLFKRKSAIPGFVLSLLGAEFSVFLLKFFIARPRPPEEFSLFFLNSPSFPSGHSALAMVFYGFLIFAFTSRLKNLVLRCVIGGIGAILIIAIAGSRIYLGVHYPLDVAAGLLLGGLWLLFGIRATRALEKLR